MSSPKHGASLQLLRKTFFHISSLSYEPHSITVCEICQYWLAICVHTHFYQQLHRDITRQDFLPFAANTQIRSVPSYRSNLSLTDRVQDSKQAIPFKTTEICDWTATFGHKDISFDRTCAVHTLVESRRKIPPTDDTVMTCLRGWADRLIVDRWRRDLS